MSHLMIDQVILESKDGELISYEKLAPALTPDQVRRTLSQHHSIKTFCVDRSIAKVVLEGTLEPTTEAATEPATEPATA